MTFDGKLVIHQWKSSITVTFNSYYLRQSPYSQRTPRSSSAALEMRQYCDGSDSCIDASQYIIVQSAYQYCKLSIDALIYRGIAVYLSINAVCNA